MTGITRGGFFIVTLVLQGNSWQRKICICLKKKTNVFSLLGLIIRENKKHLELLRNELISFTKNKSPEINSSFKNAFFPLRSGHRFDECSQVNHPYRTSWTLLWHGVLSEQLSVIKPGRHIYSPIQMGQNKVQLFLQKSTFACRLKWMASKTQMEKWTQLHNCRAFIMALLDWFWGSAN